MSKATCPHLGPIRILLDNPRGRDQLARARLYNRNNGVREEDVPRYLLWKFPLGGEAGKK